MLMRDLDYPDTFAFNGVSFFLAFLAFHDEIVACFDPPSLTLTHTM